MNTGAGKVSGSWETSRVSASIPPAEAPTTTRARVVLEPAAFDVVIAASARSLYRDPRGAACDGPTRSGGEMPPPLLELLPRDLALRVSLAEHVERRVAPARARAPRPPPDDGDDAGHHEAPEHQTDDDHAGHSPHHVHAMSPPRSDGMRKRLRNLTALPPRGALQRLHCARVVEVQHRIELLGQARLEVVTGTLALRPIDDADGTLESCPRQLLRDLDVVEHAQQEARHPHLVEQRFVTAA